MYVEVTGILPYGTMPFTVRWQDGDWTGDEPVVSLVKAEQAKGPVSLTAVGPLVPPDTARGIAWLVPSIFERVDKYDTDIPLGLPALPKGAVA